MSIKKRIKPGRIEPSPNGDALVVHFTTEITHLDEDGMPGHHEKFPDSREVPLGEALQSLCADGIPALAQEIVKKCKYIPETKTAQVEQALARLVAAVDVRGDDNAELVDVAPPVASMASAFGQSCRGASLSTTTGSHASRAVGTSRSRDRMSRTTEWSGSPARRSFANVLPDATVEDLDEYADELYEDRLDLKAAGAQRLLRLCTEARFLDNISGHNTILGVLSRELKETGKRSNDLAVAITGVFVCLARFSRFHRALVQHQCGEAAMKVVEYENRRRAVLQKELKLSQGQLVARGSAVTPEERTKLEKEEVRARKILHRQDRLLQLCLVVLWNLAEDPAVEQQLVSNKLCHLLVQMLGRQSEDILASALGFLHKLSVFEQNKDVLVANTEALAKISELVGHGSPEVSLPALRLCYNLSFDARGREQLATQTCLLGKLPAAIQQTRAMRKVALKVLYHLSGDAALRSTIALKHPACFPPALQLVAKCKETPVDPDSAALAVNLAADEACAAILVEAEAFPKVVVRAVLTSDALLLKAVRHVASHRAVRPRLLQVMRGAPCAEGDQRADAWLHELLRVIGASLDGHRHDVLVEAVGVLSALDCASPEVPWPELCDAGLVSLLQRMLVAGLIEDDVLLEAVILTGALALDSECWAPLAASEVPKLLPELTAHKREDAEIVVQLLFALRCMLLSPEIAEDVLQNQEAFDDIMGVMREAMLRPEADLRAQAVQAAGQDLLDLVVALSTQPGSAAASSPWAAQIKAFRFELHNAEWCQRLGSRAQARESVGQTLQLPGKEPHSAKSGDSRRSKSHEPGGGRLWSDANHLSDREWDASAFAMTSGSSRHRSRDPDSRSESNRHHDKERRRKAEKLR